MIFLLFISNKKLFVKVLFFFLQEKHSENLYYHNELQKVHALLITEVEKNKDHIQQIEELKQQLINVSITRRANNLEKQKSNILIYVVL